MGAVLVRLEKCDTRGGLLTYSELIGPWGLGDGAGRDVGGQEGVGDG